MALVQVVRPRTVTVVTCDCGCGAECDDLFPDYDPTNDYTRGTGCGWLAVHPQNRTLVRDWDRVRATEDSYREWPRAVPLYFASRRCLARWAFRQMIESGECVVPTPPELRMGVADYGRAA